MEDRSDTRTVVLVHGTFGRRSKWAMPGSAMWSRIEERFPDARVVRSEWSGRNRHSDRWTAACSLAEVLNGSAGDIAIVAHSHGGNVAAAALALEARDADVAGSRLLVTLGTPFIHARRYSSNAGAFARGERLGRLEKWQGRPPLSRQRLMFLMVAYALAAFLMVGLEGWGRESRAELGGTVALEEERWRPLGGWTLAAVNVVNPFLMAGAMVIGVVCVLFGLLWLVSLRLLRHPEVVAQHLEDAAEIEVDATAITTSGDEAELGLRTGQLIGGAARGASTGLDRMFFGRGTYGEGDGVGQLIVSLLGLFVVAASLSAFGDGFAFADRDALPSRVMVNILVALDSPGDELVVIVACSLAVFAVLGFVLTAVLEFEYVFIGVDSQRLVNRVRTSISASPAFEHRSRRVQLSESGSGLRHSRLMEDPVAIDAAVDAVADLMP